MSLTSRLACAVLALAPFVPSGATRDDLDQARAKFSAAEEGACNEGAAICVRVNNVAAVELLLDVLRTMGDRGGSFLPQAHYRDMVWGALAQITDPYARERVKVELEKNKQSAWTRQWCAELLGLYHDG